jgi:hypothetical protein
MKSTPDRILNQMNSVHFLNNLCRQLVACQYSYGVWLFTSSATKAWRTATCRMFTTANSTHSQLPLYREAECCISALRARHAKISFCVSPVFFQGSGWQTCLVCIPDFIPNQGAEILMHVLGDRCSEITFINIDHYRNLPLHFQLIRHKSVYLWWGASWFILCTKRTNQRGWAV